MKKIILLLIFFTNIYVIGFAQSLRSTNSISPTISGPVTNGGVFFERQRRGKFYFRITNNDVKNRKDPYASHTKSGSEGAIATPDTTKQNQTKPQESGKLFKP